MLESSGKVGALRMAAAIAATGLLVSIAFLGAARADPADRRQIERGRHLYQVYCQSCHGPEGRGDGPTAKDLLVAPPDLTRISRRNGGEFPFDAVLSAIDGRDSKPGHGPRYMQVWGIALQEWDKDTDQYDEIAGKILHLTQYVRSLQRSKPD